MKQNMREADLKFSRSIKFSYTLMCKFIFHIGVTSNDHQTL